MVRFSEDVVGLNDLKTQAARVVDRVVRSRRPALVARRGKGVAVLVELGEFERMQDELAFRHAVEGGIADIEAGTLHDHEEAVAILDSFGKPLPRKTKGRKRRR